MRRGLILVVLALAGCGSSTPSASEAPTPAAPNGTSGTSGPAGATTGAPPVVPTGPTGTASAAATPPPDGQALSNGNGGSKAAPTGPTAMEKCLAKHGVKAGGAPSQETMTAALAACAPPPPSPTPNAGGAAAPPDPLKACLERNRPAHPSDKAVRRVIAKCAREVGAG